jgi:hypothetical protein
MIPDAVVRRGHPPSPKAATDASDATVPAQKLAFIRVHLLRGSWGLPSRGFASPMYKLR